MTTNWLAYEVIEIGGLSAYADPDKIVHWNINVPGFWVGPHALSELGSYVSRFCKNEPGVYRLVGLDGAGKPAVLNRMCGSDETGTLYIGAEGKTFADRSRLTKLARSLQAPRRARNGEHKAGYRLRGHATLSARFPPDRVALTWCYCPTPFLAEATLFDVYFSSFGDTPPLNFRRSEM